MKICHRYRKYQSDANAVQVKVKGDMPVFKVGTKFGHMTTLRWTICPLTTVCTLLTRVKNCPTEYIVNNGLLKIPYSINSEIVTSFFLSFFLFFFFFFFFFFSFAPVMSMMLSLTWRSHKAHAWVHRDYTGHLAIIGQTQSIM